jgi:hypothetical protein
MKKEKKKRRSKWKEQRFRNEPPHLLGTGYAAHCQGSRNDCKDILNLSDLRGKESPDPLQIRVIQWHSSHLRHIDPSIMHFYTHHIASEICHCATVVVEEP